MNTPVVDFHMHLIKTGHHSWVNDYLKNFHKVGFEEFKREIAKPANFVRLMKENGVEYGVVLAEQNPVTSGICTNEEVADFCRDFDCLIPFGTVNPHLVSRPAEVVERLVKEKRFKGLKLYPTDNYFFPNDRIMYPVYSKAEELGIPVMFHTGSSVFRGARLKYGDPLYCDDVAVDFPNLTIILAHSGRGFWYDRAFFLARLHRKVYMEISGLPPQNLLKYFPDLESNADKIIFGTDWPGVPGIKGNIEAVKKLPVSDGAKKKILGGNAAKILGICQVMEGNR